MRGYVYNFIKSVKQDVPEIFSDTIHEFGSYIVEDQHNLALRNLFADKSYIGCDMRDGPGVDRVEDVMNLSFGDGSIDTLLTVDTFEHVENPFKMMAEIERTLSDSGTAMVITVMNFRIHAYPDDYWRPTPSALNMLTNINSVVFYGDNGPIDHPETVGVFMSKSEIPTKLIDHIKSKGYKIYGE